MAIINWQGIEIQAKLIEQLPNGNYLMESQGTAHRVEPGTVIEVKQSEIVGLNIGNATFLGSGAQQGQAAANPMPQAAPVILTKADMLPAAPVVIAREQPVTDLAKALDAGATVSVAPRKSLMTTAKTPQLNSLMDGFNSMIAAVEDSATAVHKKFAALQDQAKTSTTKLSQAADPIIAMVKQIDDTANQLTNGAPPGPLPGSTT